MPNRYESEIEDILRQADDLISDQEAQTDEQRRDQLRASLLLEKVRALKISPSRIMMTGICLFLIALILMPMGITTTPLVWGGLALLIVAYLLFFILPKSDRGYEKRWRGRVIEEQPTIVQRLKQWLKM